MEFAKVEFVKFDAEDVITTSKNTFNPPEVRLWVKSWTPDAYAAANLVLSGNFFTHGENEYVEVNNYYEKQGTRKYFANDMTGEVIANVVEDDDNWIANDAADIMMWLGLYGTVANQ